MVRDMLEKWASLQGLPIALPQTGLLRAGQSEVRGFDDLMETAAKREHVRWKLG